MWGRRDTSPPMKNLSRTHFELGGLQSLDAEVLFHKRSRFVRCGRSDACMAGRPCFESPAVVDRRPRGFIEPTMSTTLHTSEPLENTGRTRRSRWLWSLRIAVVLGWLVLGMFRVGANDLDRWTTSACWTVPSMWHAVADVAINSGVVDGTIGSVRAPFRRASIHKFVRVRYAVVTVSDYRRSKVFILDERYNLVGHFRRQISDPMLVTDMSRGFDPVSHLWPIYDSHGDGRVDTLIGFSTIGDARSAGGTYAYLSVGRDDVRVMFVCSIDARRPNPPVTIVVEDYDRDGFDDIIVHAIEKRGPTDVVEPEAVASFLWNEEVGAFKPSVSDAAAAYVAFWCSQPNDRVSFSSDQWMDEAAIRSLPLQSEMMRLDAPRDGS